MKRSLGFRVLSVILCFWACLSLISCGDACEVTYELSGDRLSAEFVASASASRYGKWSVNVDNGDVVSLEDSGSKNSVSVAVCQKRLTGKKEGETYVAFYIQNANAEYTKIFGFNITVDSMLQLSVSVAESDSMLGKE